MKFKFYLLFVCWIFGSFTHAAEMICGNTAEKAALVVIDMQPYFFSRSRSGQAPLNVNKNYAVDKAQIELIQKAKSYNIPIIFIEYTYPGYAMGETNSSLKNAVAGYSKLKVIKKDRDGFFDPRNSYRQELVTELQKNNVGTLLIAGANGGACVLQSIKGALDGNCNVVTYDKAIIDYNYNEFIYPYTGYYKNIKPQCESCKLKEVQTLEEASDYIARGSSANPSNANTFHNGAN